VWLTFRFFDEAFELSFKWNVIKFDLFFNYNFGGKYEATGHFSDCSYNYYYYSEYFLCSAHFLEIRVNVPCDPNKIIIDEYGPEWNKLIKTWKYELNLFSRGDLIYWSHHRKRKSFTEFRV
jgi:hypothetical protein